MVTVLSESFGKTLKDDTTVKDTTLVEKDYDCGFEGEREDEEGLELIEL